MAAGAVGAAICLSSAGIEVARAWTSRPHAAAEAGHVVGGMIVALFAVAAFGFAYRTRSLAIVAVASAFALFAKGGTLVLEGETIGALFLGLAPMVFLLSQAAFVSLPPPAHESIESARMVALWMKTSRRKTAPVAPRAASPTPLAMRASQATIMDALPMMPNDSSNGPITLRSCDSSP